MTVQLFSYAWIFAAAVFFGRLLYKSWRVSSLVSVTAADDPCSSLQGR